MELLNQMDGFDSLGKVKIIMATNRPDTVRKGEGLGKAKW
jgi:26S proteasome regulatory subunit T4